MQIRLTAAKEKGLKTPKNHEAAQPLPHQGCVHAYGETAGLINYLAAMYPRWYAWGSSVADSPGSVKLLASTAQTSQGWVIYWIFSILHQGLRHRTQRNYPKSVLDDKFQAVQRERAPHSLSLGLAVGESKASNLIPFPLPLPLHHPGFPGMEEHRFSISSEGEAHWILGISIHHDTELHSLSISQRDYIEYPSL